MGLKGGVTGDSPHRVLHDLSYASLGYCGIAQDSRVLLKTLYQLQNVGVTGLMFGDDDAVIGHKFASSAGLARRLENQAIFMQALVDHQPPSAHSATLRRLQHLRRLWRLTLARRVNTDSLDNETFWDCVWRGLLAPALSGADIEIARQCPMLLANLGGRMLTARSLFNLPAPRLDTRDYDFAIFHNCRTIHIGPGTCKLVRYYDMIPGVRPDLVGSHLDIRSHFAAIRRCIGDSIFVCDSGPARDDLLRAFPELEERSVVIPPALSDGYCPEALPKLLTSIVRNRRAEWHGQSSDVRSRIPTWKKMPPYLLMTAAIEPRKNHVMLVRAFEKLLSRHTTSLRLVIVGQPGWKFGEALQAMKPLIRQQRIIHLVDVPIEELRVLSTHAEAVVFPSLYEGFGLGPLEAMCCRTPAIISDIAAHRWACGDAAVYFDPYCVDSCVGALEQVLFCESPDLRCRLVQAGINRVQRYSVAAVGAQWLALFEELRRQTITSDVTRACLARMAG